MLLTEGDRRDGDRGDLKEAVLLMEEDGRDGDRGEEAVLLTEGDRRDGQMVTEERRLCC